MREEKPTVKCPICKRKLKDLDKAEQNANKYLKEEGLKALRNFLKTLEEIRMLIDENIADVLENITMFRDDKNV